MMQPCLIHLHRISLRRRALLGSRHVDTLVSIVDLVRRLALNTCPSHVLPPVLEHLSSTCLASGSSHFLPPVLHMCALLRAVTLAADDDALV